MTSIKRWTNRCAWLLLSMSAVACSAGANADGEDELGQLSQSWRSERRGASHRPGRPARAGGRHAHHQGQHTPPTEPGSVPLQPDASGRIDADSNSLSVEGQWRVFADSYGPNGRPPGVCQAAGYLDSECSLATAPDSTALGFPNAGGVLCTEGSTAQVLYVNGSPDYAHMWGIGIGVSLAEPEGAARGVFDASARRVAGISFDIDNVPSAGLRVLVDTPSDPETLGPSYWGAAEFFPPSPVVAGTNLVPFDEVVSPEAAPRALDTTQLLSIGFLVPANEFTRTSFGYCISHLELLLE